MPKTVFNNAMVAHVWAQQDQKEGRSNNGNFWFEHEAIFSYRTAMATFLKPWHYAVSALPIVFVNRDHYSVSTSQHQSDIRMAVDYNKYEVVKVSGEFMQQLARSPDFFTRNIDAETRKRMVKEEFERNFKEAEILLIKAARARTLANMHYQSALSFVDVSRKLAKLFKVRLYVPKTLRDAEAGTVDGVKHFAKAAVDADKKRRVAAKKAHEKRERQLRALSEHDFQSWLQGVGLQCPHPFATSPSGGVYMRRVNRMGQDGGEDLLQTSQGATVPWRHAVRVFQALKAIRATGQPWVTNGRVLRVGMFQVDRIEANGDFKAGCHQFKWADIEPFAIEQGVFDVEASDAAISPKEQAA